MSLSFVILSTISLSLLLLILATATPATAQLDHEASAQYFKEKMKICSELEALGVLDEEGIPEEYKDLVTEEIYQDCRDFLY